MKKMEETKMKKNKIFWLCLCSFFLAFEIMFLTVPFFKIELGVFTIVFSALPIAVATIVLGYRASLILGISWGVFSFAEAFYDSFGLIMLENSPVGTFIVLGLSRVLVGLCLALAYKVLSKKIQIPHFNAIVICLLSSVLNNLFFMGGLCIFFRSTFMEIIYPILGTSILFNMIPETVVCIVVGTPIIAILQKNINKYYKIR